jgi:hypothetical protein
MPNVRDALAITKWAEEKKQWFLAKQPTQKEAAELCSAELGLKVSTTSIKHAMEHCGIKRKSKAEAELALLREEAEKLRQIVLKQRDAS